MARTGEDKNQSPGKTPDPKGRKILGRKLMQNEKNAEKEETAASTAREERIVSRLGKFRILRFF